MDAFEELQEKYRQLEKEKLAPTDCEENFDNKVHFSIFCNQDGAMNIELSWYSKNIDDDILNFAKGGMPLDMFIIAHISFASKYYRRAGIFLNVLDVMTGDGSPALINELGASLILAGIKIKEVMENKNSNQE